MKPTPEQEKRVRQWLENLWEGSQATGMFVPMPCAVSNDFDSGADFRELCAEYGRAEDGMGYSPDYREIWQRRWTAQSKAR